MSQKALRFCFRSTEASMKPANPGRQSGKAFDF